jgi:hypothetical protein
MDLKKFPVSSKYIGWNWDKRRFPNRNYPVPIQEVPYYRASALDKAAALKS